MVQPALISDAADFLFFNKLNLNGKKIIITLGGTEEEVDSVRVISNKSTGKLGKTIAMLSLLSGAQVTLISTVNIEDCGYASVINVKTASEMSREVEKHFKKCDYLVMAAAVSDFKVDVKKGKIKRDKGLNLDLIPTNDILKAVAKKKTKQKVIGFCLAEQEALQKTALEKCKNKHCDYIIGNPLNSFGKNKRDIVICNKEKVLSEFRQITLEETAFRILSLISI